jgi:hypothetical protein
MPQQLHLGRGLPLRRRYGADVRPGRPRLLSFHWEGGKTYFPNNLVQFIRPAQDALVVGVGYQSSSAQGDVEALGCLEDVDIIRDQEIEVTVQLNAP